MIQHTADFSDLVGYGEARDASLRVMRATAYVTVVAAALGNTTAIQTLTARGFTVSEGLDDSGLHAIDHEHEPSVAAASRELAQSFESIADAGLAECSSRAAYAIATAKYAIAVNFS